MRRASWVVTNYNPRSAGLRYRCLYPMAELQRRGYAVERYDPVRKRTYECVVLNGWSVFPSVASTDSANDIVRLAQQLKDQGARIILDNCDNQFVNAPNEKWRLAQERLRTLLCLADTLVTCSAELVDLLAKHSILPEHVEVIGDPVEEIIRVPGDTYLRSMLSPARKLSWMRHFRHALSIYEDHVKGRVPLVWFGSHGNNFAEGGMLDLLQVRELLEDIHERQPISLTIISNHKQKYLDNFSAWRIPTRYVEWDRVTFVKTLRLHKICLIPAARNAFTRGKSANRPAMALFHGLNVICDPVPSYYEFRDCISIGDWKGGLQTYLSDESLRKSHLAEGQAIVRSRYELRVIAECWRKVLFPTER